MAINDDWSASLQNEFPFMQRERTEEETIYQRWVLSVQQDGMRC